MAAAIETQRVRTLHTSIRGRLKLFDDSGVETVLPISALQTTFVVNTFPTAQIIVPVGRAADVDAEGEVIRARELAERMTQFQRIECFLTMKGEYAPGVMWPAKDIRVFNGYVTGTSLTRVSGGMSVVVQATHWLMDLDASSSLSSQFVAGSPVILGLPAAGPDVGALKNEPFDPMLADIKRDLWNEGIKRKFISLCNGGTLITQIDSLLPDGGELSNALALPRLNGSAEACFDNADVVDVPKLTFFDELDQALDGAAQTWIGDIVTDGSGGNSTLWEQLARLADEFHFVVIPTVDSAVCAPLAPCIAGDDPARHLTIQANEYTSFNPGAGVRRLLRGLSINGMFSSAWGALDDKAIEEANETQPFFLASDGIYIVDYDLDLPAAVRARAKNGMLRFTNAPQWMQSSYLEAVMGRANAAPEKNPANTKQGVVEAETSVPAEEIAFDRAAFRRFGDAYAKWRYWMDHFSARTGSMTGKLRFDIAPGSVVRIEDIDGKLYDDPAEAGYMYALVTGVRVNVNVAEGRSGDASTTLELSHIRREAEREMGTKRHPLYKDVWVGTVLQNVPFEGAAEDGVFIVAAGLHEKLM